MTRAPFLRAPGSEGTRACIAPSTGNARRGVCSFIFLGAICVLILSLPPALSQTQRDRREAALLAAPSRPTIWRDPGRVEELDFVNGPGGTINAPKPPFTFVEEDTGGTNPKVNVTDAAGQRWGVKWGSEVKCEVFASRLVWAAGYYVEPSYFVKFGRILGVTKLGRARKHVASDGSFTNARFELKEKGIIKKTDKESWRWDQNPFVGTPELNGLKIMVMLTSNWDPKDQRASESNTAIYTTRQTGEVRYLLSDWGATMGKWGGVFSREKWDCEGFASQTQKFVTGVKDGLVLFGYAGKQQTDIRDGIRVNDARRLLGFVGRITDAQIRAGLDAAGATPGEIDCFAKAIRERINQLKNAAR